MIYFTLMILIIPIILTFMVFGVGWVLSAIIPISLLQGAWLYLGCLAFVSFALLFILLYGVLTSRFFEENDEEDEDDYSGDIAFVSRDIIDAVTHGGKQKKKKKR